jgi:hypothetical protein
LEALRQSVNRDCPFGEADWQKQVAVESGLEAAMRQRGRPPETGEIEHDRAEEGQIDS